LFLVVVIVSFQELVTLSEKDTYSFKNYQFISTRHWPFIKLHCVFHVNRSVKATGARQELRIPSGSEKPIAALPFQMVPVGLCKTTRQLDSLFTILAKLEAGICDRQITNTTASAMTQNIFGKRLLALFKEIVILIASQRH
jgi:hypothetical protein